MDPGGRQRTSFSQEEEQTTEEGSVVDRLGRREIRRRIQELLAAYCRDCRDDGGINFRS